MSLDNLTEEQRNKILNYQNLQQTYDLIINQKNQTESRLRETEFVIEELEKVDNRKRMQIVVMNHLLKEEAAYDKDIFRYVCYPILKEKIKKIKEKNASRSST